MSPGRCVPAGYNDEFYHVPFRGWHYDFLTFKTEIHSDP